MTFCLGWKNKDRSFLMSDTAITTTDKSKNYKPQKSQTSLGESSFHIPGITVEEWALKQFRVDTNFIICYSGNVDVAISVVSTIRKYYFKDNPLKSVQLAIDSIRDNGRNPLIQLIFSFAVNNEIKLFSFNASGNGGFVEVQENHLIQIGSLTSTEYFDIVNMLFYKHILTLPNSTQQFYQFLLFLQHLGLHDNTLKNYVGGLYSGVYLTLENSYWNEDTSIIIYDRNLGNQEIKLLGRINVFFRYDCLIMNSSFTNQKEIFIDSPNHPVYKFEELQEEISKIHFSLVPKIIAYLAKDERIMSIIKTNGKNINAHFSDTNNDGEFTVLLPIHYLKLLKGEYFPPNNLFNIHWDEIS
jgi:hypothetical protein